MSLSVLNFAVGLLIFSPSAANDQMSSKEVNAYRAFTPSIASIIRNGEPIGSAALVDSSGLFVTHLNAVYAKRVSARLSDGRMIVMVLKSTDDPTKLAVLQADDWIKSARPLSTATGLKSGDRLVTVLPTGLIRAEYVGTKSGLVTQSHRMMPLSEISFEAPADRIGGGLVMTESGEIVGFLNAALRSNAEADIQVKPSQVEGSDDGPTPMGTAAATFEKNLASRAMKTLRRPGPADMTVAYTPAPRVLRRTIDSLIRGKDVDRPSIGVDVKNAPAHRGALIEKVEPGSAADMAGLRAGDIVIQIDDEPVNDQMDLGRIVMDQEIGKTLIIKVIRGQTLILVPVTVSSKSGQNRTTGGSST